MRIIGKGKTICQHFVEDKRYSFETNINRRDFIYINSSLRTYKFVFFEKNINGLDKMSSGIYVGKVLETNCQIFDEWGKIRLQNDLLVEWFDGSNKLKTYFPSINARKIPKEKIKLIYGFEFE